MRHILNDIVNEAEKCSNCSNIIRADDEYACSKYGHNVLRGMSAVFCTDYETLCPIRVARREDGSLYASRTEQRSDYADETVCCHDRAADAIIDVMKMNE